MAPLARITDPAPSEIVDRFLQKAPVDLQGMADALGLIVLRQMLPNDISGKILRVGRATFKIIVNSTHPQRRQRFTLAHEIAHYVLHRYLIGDGVVDDGLYRSKELPDDIEREANRYAAILLMPAPLVREAYKTVKSVAGIADAFEVSDEVARIRMKELRLG